MKKYHSLIAINLSLITLGFFIYVLYIGTPILIPFVVAVLLSFIILSLAGFFKRIGLFPPLSLIASLLSISVIIYIISHIINTNINDIISGAPGYQAKLTVIIQSLAKEYNIDQKLVTDQLLAKINFTSIISGTASIITNIVKNTGIIFFFTLFILLESKSFVNKLLIITGGEKSSFFVVFEQIKTDIKSYFLIKTLVSLMVGFLSAAIMFIFGLDFFVFWAFLIFLLNYIPNVGSIIAVFFPVVFSLIQFESFSLSFIFLILMVIIQVLMGNIVEPRLMGNKLNLSPLVILISLIFWATIWGPIGMLLSVPIMVMVNIVLAHIEVTRPIAILLSERGIVRFSQMKEIPSGKLSIKRMKKLLKRE